jgi:hypothetical protein
MSILREWEMGWIGGQPSVIAGARRGNPSFLCKILRKNDDARVV